MGRGEVGRGEVGAGSWNGREFELFHVIPISIDHYFT